MRVVIALFFIIPAFSVYSKNYYVNRAKGNDRYNGLSATKPKSTIQAAANITKPGDTVFVMDGTYKNNCTTCNVLEISRSGNEKKNIIYINFPGHHPVIKFDGWAGISIQKGASYIQLTGFEVIGNNSNIKLAEAIKQPGSCTNPKGTFNPKFNGNGIAVTGSSKSHSSHIIISGNTVHDCGGGGIGATQADYIIVANNTVYNNSWYSLFGTSGIAFYQFYNSDNKGGYHNRIRQNKCFNNKSLVPCIKACTITDGNGIIVDDFRNWQNKLRPKPYANKTLIENNVCWYNGGTAIHTFQSDHVDIVNNTAYCNSKTKDAPVGQILPGGSSYVQIVNNIIVTDSANVFNSNFMNTKIVYANNLHYNITYPSKIDAVIFNATCITGLNPEFVNPGNNLKADFSLKASSPAIDKGNRTLYSKQDFNGRLRPNGTLPDIGAYEH